MKSSPESKTTQSKTPSLIVIVVGIVVLTGLLWAGVALYGTFNKSKVNYAEEAAKPLEAALTKAGATKQCSRGDSGRGADNDRPNYMALYEIPGNADAATTLLHSVAKESGFNLVDGPYPPNPGDNRFYSDSVTKQSTYSDLQDGRVALIAEVFGSSVYNGKDNALCGVQKTDSVPHDKTTVDLTINLPAFKR